MSTEQFNSVWDAIEDTPQEAENLRLRSRLMMAIAERIKAKAWTQKEAADRLGVTQPRISDLVRGKIDLFSLDSLVNMVAAAGLHIEMSVRHAVRTNRRRAITQPFSSGITSSASHS